jgi:hypothetical protein
MMERGEEEEAIELRTENWELRTISKFLHSDNFEMMI